MSDRCPARSSRRPRPGGRPSAERVRDGGDRWPVGRRGTRRFPTPGGRDGHRRGRRRRRRPRPRCAGRPRELLGRGLPRRLRPGVPAAAGWVTSASTRRPRPGRVPQRRGCGVQQPEVENNAFYCAANTRTATRSVTTGPSSTSWRRATAVPPGAGDGARIRARGPGAGRLPAGVDRGGDAGRLLRRDLDPGGSPTATHPLAIRAGELDDVLRGYLLLRDPWAPALLR